ncbi:porin [Luteolibacter soli]|uniref:Porin n=1 Tax=Luteolibacter soli TaxID=3135280 RepID=A0ABU9B2H9_9BACT
MKYQTTQATTALLGALSSLAFAGDPAPAPAPAAESGSMFADFNFCEWLSSKPGTVKIPENPWVQSLVFEGRYHWNAAYIDGEGTNGRDFSETYTDARRFRLGGKIGFLNYFAYKGVVNMVDDQRFNGGELHYGYEDFDESYFTFDLVKAFSISGVDALTLNYGRFKWHGGLEARTSSNALITVERSALSNKLYQSARPTGVFVTATKGRLSGIFGVSSTDEGTDDAGVDTGNVEGWGGWNDGVMFNTELVYSATDDLRFGWEFIYNNADERFHDEDSLLDYRWATTLSGEYAIGNGGVSVEGFLGDNGGADMQSNAKRRGNFWGVVVMPYYWIVPAKLQAVVQLMYAGAEEDQGIRTNSRYVRATNYGGGGNPNIVNGGRGDELFTAYAGLNYLVCGDNLKFQLGAELSHLETPNVGDGDVDALTWQFGFRTFF